MLQPKRSKYRKQMRGKNRGVATRGTNVEFGEFGLQAIAHGEFSARQIEAARKVLSRATKRVGQTWIRVFPDHPNTQKPNGVKMGSGKGDIKEYVAKIQPQKMLFELGGVSEEVAREAFRKASHKISMKTRFVKRILAEGETIKLSKVHHEEPEEEVVTPTEEVATEPAKEEATV